MSKTNVQNSESWPNLDNCVKLGAKFQMISEIFFAFSEVLKWNWNFVSPPSVRFLTSKREDKTNFLGSVPIFLNTHQTLAQESYSRNVYRNHLRNISKHFPIPLNIPNNLRTASFTVLITSTSGLNRKSCEDTHFVLVWVLQNCTSQQSCFYWNHFTHACQQFHNWTKYQSYGSDVQQKAD